MPMWFWCGLMGTLALNAVIFGWLTVCMVRQEQQVRKARAALNAATVRHIRSSSHDLTLLPLSQSPVAQRIREQIADNECRRLRDDLDRWGA